MSGTSSTPRSGATSHRAEASGQGASTKDAAKEQASQVAQGASERGKQVAGTAKEQASHVKDEAVHQAKDLLGEARSQLGQHAGDQQQHLAGVLRSLTSELDEMASSSSGGPAAGLARQASQRTGAVASWLENGDTGSMLADVRSFASRRPGTFLAMAAGAGVLAGRLTRGLKDASSNDSGSSTTSTSTTTARTATVSETPVSGGPVYGTEGTQQRGGTSL